MMPHIPTFSGVNPDVPNYGHYHGFVRTNTRLGFDAAASVSLMIYRDVATETISPSLYIVGRKGSYPPHPGDYNPMSPAHGLFFNVPYFQTSPGNYESALRVRFRDPGATNVNIGFDAWPLVWRDPAADEPGYSVRWSASTQNYVGSASVSLDIAFAGNTSNYQTYLIQNRFIA